VIFFNIAFFRSTSRLPACRPLRGLRDAVRRLEHGVDDRRVRFGLSQLLFVIVVIKAIMATEAADNPWKPRAGSSGRASPARSTHSRRRRS